MARRYSRILQATALAQAVDNYVNHITTAATRPRNVGSGTPRDAQQALAIEPFTIDVTASDKYLAFAGETARTRFTAAVGAAAVEVGGAVTARRVAGWKPARITMFVGTGSSAPATSAITGLRYLKYNGNSFSHPFGKKAATDTEYDTFLEIRAALAGTNRRFSIRSEAYSQR